jgi:hypothetical protein
MEKTSIKHYFNTRLKSESINGVLYSPLYVQIIRKQRTLQMKSGLVTEKITPEMLQTPKIQALCKKEAELITAFFDFAESIITDFHVTKSKTPFGDLLDFYCYNRFFDFLKWIKTGFVEFETRINLYKKFREYLTANVPETVLPVNMIQYITPNNLGLHAIEQNGEMEYISFDIPEIKFFHEKNILIDLEAGKFEFVELLQRFNHEKYTSPYLKKGTHNPDITEFMTFYIWQKNKSEILQYIKSQAESYTLENLPEIIQCAEKCFIDRFKKAYSDGIKE